MSNKVNTTRRDIGIIAALNSERVIGKAGKLAWHYPEDLKRFKQVTLGATLIMGRLTWASLPIKPLPGRRNLVVTQKEAIDGAEVFSSLIDAISAVAEGDIWIIGGARLFEEGLNFANVLDLTYVPDKVTGGDLVYFPRLDGAVWGASTMLPIEGGPLYRQIFRRRLLASG